MNYEFEVTRKVVTNEYEREMSEGETKEVEVVPSLIESLSEFETHKRLTSKTELGIEDEKDLTRLRDKYHIQQVVIDKYEARDNLQEVIDKITESIGEENIVEIKYRVSHLDEGVTCSEGKWITHEVKEVMK